MTAVACPVCLERFQEPAAFALHVASCTTPQDGSSAAAAAPTTPAGADASCPICHTVYTSALTAHEIKFHEEECERVNGSPEPIAADASGADAGGSDSGGGGSGRPAKRSREASAGDKAVATATKLYPAHCAVCENGGRALLHCAGKCARSFHPMCVEEINAREYAATGAMADAAAASLVPSGSGASFASAITRDKMAQREWVCGECSRGVHTCQLCGFLGHEAHELVKCKLPDCGFFFHPACLKKQSHRVQTPLVCPRHTCTRCRAIEPDMTTLWSCAKCCKGMHIRCREAAAGGSGSNTPIKSRIDVLDANFYVCDAHKAIEPLPVDRKHGQFAALRMKVRPGDVVLILEYGNLLLPSTAKDAAPDAYNQWGVVQRVENLGDGISSAWWTQLVTVALFSDNSSIDVPNRYVLPVSSMQAHPSPTQMVNDMVKWHAMCELHLRYLERDSVEAVVAEAPAILSTSETAFKARADTLGITPAATEKHALGGLEVWKEFVSGSTSPTFLTSTAPLFVALDTRGKRKVETAMAVEAEASAQQDSSEHEKPDSGNPDDGDVDMDGDNEDASARSSPSGGSNTTGDPSVHSASSSLGIDSSVLEVMAASVEKVEASSASLQQTIDDVLSARETVPDDANEKVDTTETIEHESASAGVADVGSGAGEGVAMEGDHEKDQDELQAFEQRMPIDDLLNPLSQHSPERAPFVSPPHATAAGPVEVKEEGNDVDLTKPAKKRSLDESTRGVVNVLDVLDTTADMSSPPIAKKAKVAVKFDHLPLELKKPRGSVFSRAPLIVPPPLSRKQKVLAAMPDILMRDLDAQVNALFEAELEGKLPYKMPTFRPAFYRPTPFLYRGPRIDRRVDAISRALLCQDKRNLRCLVRHASSSSSSSASSRNCPHKSRDAGDHVTFVCLDLMGIPSFAMLEGVVRDQLAELLQSADAATAPRDVRLSYCLYDGSEHALPTRRAADKAPEWLCFCANVVHLTATIV